MTVASSYGTLGSETGVIFFERRWKFDATKRGIIYCHGRGGSTANTVPSPDPLMLEMVRRGYPAIATDLGGIATWGNDTAQTAMSNAFSQLKSTAKAANLPPLIIAFSMGNLPALLWAKSNSVAAIVGAAPVLDLADVHDNNRGGYATDIETAYGGSAGYAAAIGTHNPATTTASFTSIPSRFYYSVGADGSGDGIVMTSVVTTFATNVGANSNATSVGNVAHTAVPASVPLDAATSFLLAYA